MRAGRFSETALGAAFIRAHHHQHDDPKVFDDPYARALLTDIEHQQAEQRLTNLLPNPERERVQLLTTEPERISFILRGLSFVGTQLSTYRYCEDCLAAAMSNGVRQYVLLGAGMDSFVVRVSIPDELVVFEVDHPATQKLKHARLTNAGFEPSRNARFVPVDFERGSVDEALLDNGFQKDKPAFFSWLNVTMYLTTDAVLKTLNAVCDISSAGSEIVFDYYVPAAPVSGETGEEMERIVRELEKLGEPIMAGFDPDSLEVKLSVLGYRSVESLTPERQASLYPSVGRHGYRFTDNWYVARARV